MPPKAKRPRKPKKASNRAEQKGKKEKEKQEQNTSEDRRTLTPQFKLVFLGVFFLTLLSLVGYVTLVVIVGMNAIDSSVVNGAIDTLKTAFFSGFGAIVGLLGGKAL